MARSRRGKGIIHSLLNVSQASLDTWVKQVQEFVSTKKELASNYEVNKQKFLALIKTATENGMTLREIALITGLSHATIAKVLKEKIMPEETAHA